MKSLWAFGVFLMMGNLMALNAPKNNKTACALTEEDVDTAFDLLQESNLMIFMQDAREQIKKFGGTLDVFDALTEAWLSFISDEKDEESPLRLSRDAGGDNAKAQLFKQIKEGSVLGLVTESHMDDPVIGPKHAIALNKKWIFYLQIEGFDHTFWAVVDRFGEEATYNYGFN